ncbi:OLC1v1038436C1 [Oldenlandia corymbosa var. corymbosa]|uniref:OLC1v1038436C1 n=1 Tax=Oldenlandia corymbosa var. corymbosa TaxID=529605 RepID=A0AAV1D249_OLDCO|nr:OLC1v1038436C1 [Oldenlandia corymbosa var. corymbosa]
MGDPSSLSSESQKRRMTYLLHKYSAPNPAGTCVFRVPKTVKETKPEAYIPQLIGLGPYHHFRPEVQLRSAQKRDAIEAYLTTFYIFPDSQSKSCITGSSSDNPLEPVIRSSYDRFIDLDAETLSWITMLDAVVLMQFIDNYLHPEKYLSLKQKKYQGVYPDIKKLVPDLFMLENQIPIVLIIQAYESLHSRYHLPWPSKTVDHFSEFCRQHSPLEVCDDDKGWVKEAFDKKTGHLLHCMYQMIMKHHVPTDDLHKLLSGTSPTSGGEQRSLLNRVIGRIKGFAPLVADKARELFHDVVEEFNDAANKAKDTGIRIPANIQKVSQIIGKLDKAVQAHDQNDDHHSNSSGDKLEIPCVSRLSAILDVEFKLLPDECGILNIELKEDGKGYLFYLPRIKFGPNSDVILRNLVAYESFVSKEEKGSTRLRDFVDLMSGLIRSEKDVKLLKDAKIIQADKNIPDSEIVGTFRGFMDVEKKPDAESKVYEVVQKATKNYSNLMVVKYGRSFMNHVAAILKLFKAMIPLFIFLFLAFQSFCDVYDCRRARPNHGSSSVLLLRNYSDQSLLELNNPHDQAKFILLPRKLLLPQ